MLISVYCLWGWSVEYVIHLIYAENRDIFGNGVWLYISTVNIYGIHT